MKYEVNVPDTLKNRLGWMMEMVDVKTSGQLFAKCLALMEIYTEAKKNNLNIAVLDKDNRPTKIIKV